MAELVPAISRELGAPLADAYGSSPWAEGPRVEPGHDEGIAAHKRTPRWSATAKMSLSPRPHMFITIRWSRGRVGAILAIWARAWAGSSAGMMPSSRLDS